MSYRIILWVETLALIGAFSAWAAPASSSCPWSGVQDVVLSSPDQAVTTVRKLSVQEIDQDLDCLGELFSSEYMGDFLYNGVVSSQLAALKSRITEPMDQAELLTQLLSLHQSAYDGHLHYSLITPAGKKEVLLPSFNPYAIAMAFHKVGNSYESVDGHEVVSCELFDPKPSIDRNGHTDLYRFIGLLQGPAPQWAKCLDPSGNQVMLPVQPIALDTLPAGSDRFHYQVLPSGILYVRIPSYMSPDQIPADEQQFLKLLEDPAFERPLIIDQRQNPGGDPSFAWEIAKRVTSRKETLSVAHFTAKQGPLGLIGLANQYLLNWQEYLSEGDTQSAQSFLAARNTLLQQVQGMVSQGATLTSYQTASGGYPNIQGTRSADYAAPIVILVDHECGSACEALPGVLKGRPGVVLMGSNTAGRIHVGSPGFVMLPHSKIGFSGGWFALAGGSLPQEGVGFAPDYYSLDGDALAAAEQWLEQQTRIRR